MSHLRLAILVVLQIGVLLVLSGCGFTTSSEERVARAETQVEAGNYRAAMIELKNVLASDSDNISARLLLARVSLGLGDAPAAEKELARAAELGAAESELLPLHIDILLTRGDFTGVLAVLAEEDVSFTQPQQWSYRGQALLALGNATTAEATYKEWLDADPSSTDAAVGVANAIAGQGKFAEAVASLEALVMRVPDDFSAWQSLGIARFQLGDYAGAETAFIEATDTIKPQANATRYAVILAGLAESQITLRKYEAAHLSLNRLKGVAPEFPMTLLLAARLARAENDYVLASRHLQKLLNISPGNHQAQLFLANMQVMQGNLGQAEQLLQRLVAASPDNLRARKLLAQVQLQQSQPGGAIEVLAPLLEGDKEDADLYTILAQANLQQGNSQAAIRRFRTATELAPDDMEAKLNLASAFLDAGETDAALEILDRVPEGAGVQFRRERLLMVALTAKDDVAGADAIADRLLAGSASQVTAATVVADHYLRTGRAHLAREILVELVNAVPDALGAKNALARIEFADGNTVQAQSLYLSVIESDEDNLVSLLGLARVAERNGDEAEMERLLKLAASGHARALGPRVLLAHMYLGRGDINDAERSANELVSIGFQNALIGEIVATVFAEAGRTEEALSQFQQAASLDPLSSRIRLGLARAYLAFDRSVDARQALQEALEISPGWPPAMMLLVLVEMRQGQVDDAMELVREFRRARPDDLSGMVLEGELFLYQQEYELAANAFHQAAAGGVGRSAVLREYQALVDGALPNPQAALEQWLDGNPDDKLARRFLAQHYQATGDADRAIQEYERILQSSPDNGDVLNNLAWQYQQEGDLERAVRLAEKAWSIDGESGSYADTLGWIYYGLGRLDESLELLSEAVRLSPDNGEILFHYAVALSHSGDSARSRKILEQLKDNNVQFPSRERANELLGQL